MSDLSKHNPVGRFEGLSQQYAQYRPSYPTTALAYLTRHIGLCRASLIADIGSGTGISSRWLATTGASVLGIEPNDEMRTEAELIPMQGVSYHFGTAEATGVESESVHLVLAAQAFHWFDAPVALKEFHRILKAEGWVGLLWNERDESDPFTSELGEVIRSASEAVKMESGRHNAAQALHESEWFTDQEIKVFENEQMLDEDGLIGRVMSASYAPRGESAAPFIAMIRKVFEEHQQDGRVSLQYQTTLHLAGKK